VRVDELTGEGRVVRASGRDASVLEGRGVPQGFGVTGWVLVNLKPLFNSDPRLDFPEDLAAHFQSYRTLAVAPVANDRALFGAVALYSASLAEYDVRRQHLLLEAANLFARSLDMNPAEPQPDINTTTAKPPHFDATLESSMTH
jgi:hypothetical protein